MQQMSPDRGVTHAAIYVASSSSDKVHSRIIPHIVTFSGNQMWQHYFGRPWLKITTISQIKEEGVEETEKLRK
jgi:hypothetical protein